MSAISITISDLAWLTPDGSSVFSKLDLNFGSERTGLVGRNGIGKTTLLKLIAGELMPSCGKINVTGSLSVLRQVVRVSAYETVADLFGATAGLALLRRAAAGDLAAEELADVDWTLEARLAFALHKAGLPAAPETLLFKLSGGQRTRAYLAAVLFAKPDFLLLDEPTNNLDKDGREAVLDVLSGWRAGAIVVSHDRGLLETMDSIVELTTLGATRYGGNWSRYNEQKQIELAAARLDLAAAEKRIGEIARKTQALAERQERRDRGGERKRAKADAPRKMRGGRKIAPKRRAEVLFVSPKDSAVQRRKRRPPPANESKSSSR